MVLLFKNYTNYLQYYVIILTPKTRVSSNPKRDPGAVLVLAECGQLKLRRDDYNLIPRDPPFANDPIMVLPSLFLGCQIDSLPEFAILYTISVNLVLGPR